MTRKNTPACPGCTAAFEAHWNYCIRCRYVLRVACVACGGVVSPGGHVCQEKPPSKVSPPAALQAYEYRYAEVYDHDVRTYGRTDGESFDTPQEASAARVESTDVVVRRLKAGPWERLDGKPLPSNIT